MRPLLVLFQTLMSVHRERTSVTKTHNAKIPLGRTSASAGLVTKATGRHA